MKFKRYLTITWVICTALSFLCCFTHGQDELLRYLNPFSWMRVCVQAPVSSCLSGFGVLIYLVY